MVNYETEFEASYGGVSSLIFWCYLLITAAPKSPWMMVWWINSTGVLQVPNLGKNEIYILVMTFKSLLEKAFRMLLKGNYQRNKLKKKRCSASGKNCVSAQWQRWSESYDTFLIHILSSSPEAPTGFLSFSSQMYTVIVSCWNGASTHFIHLWNSRSTAARLYTFIYYTNL